MRTMRLWDGYSVVDAQSVAGWSLVRCSANGGIRLTRRADGLALPHIGEARWRRDGCGVQGRGHATASLCSAEIPTGECRPGLASVGTLPARGTGSVSTQPSQHLHDL